VENNAIYQQPRRFVNPYRRKTLLSGAAFLAVYFTPTASLACGDGGGDGGEQDVQSNSSKKVPVDSMTQSQFRNLSAENIDEIMDDVEHNKITIKIDGFSPKHSINLLRMANVDRTSTRRLVKDMAKLKTKKTRKEHLRKEINRSDDLDRILVKSIKTLKKNKASKAAVKDEKTRMDDNFDYRYLVVRWARNPMEGVRK